VVDPVTIEVRINGVVLDTVPYARAFYELFEGAIYLHQARPHLVTKLDLQAKYASVKRLRTCNYITASRNHTDVDPVRVLESRGPLKTGVVHVVSKVWGYRKVCRQTFKVLELKEFSLPPLEFDSRGTFRPASETFVASRRRELSRHRRAAFAQISSRAGGSTSRRRPSRRWPP